MCDNLSRFQLIFWNCDVFLQAFRVVQLDLIVAVTARTFRAIRQLDGYRLVASLANVFHYAWFFFCCVHLSPFQFLIFSILIILAPTLRAWARMSFILPQPQSIPVFFFPSISNLIRYLLILMLNILTPFSFFILSIVRPCCIPNQWHRLSLFH